MPLEIKTISLALPYRLGTVNCYLLKNPAGFFLVDTGPRNQRRALEKELASAGCQPGSLRLILLTHGDFDHTGSAAHLRKKFGGKAAMHAGDAGMVERGDMFWNRKKGSFLIRMIAPILFGFGKSDRFSPDLFLEDGDELSGYGLDARVLSIPGHSRGSIGILMNSGGAPAGSGRALFCGDLLDNTAAPALNSIMDDPAAANASLEKLGGLEIETVYPGHGEPFLMQLLTKKPAPPAGARLR